MNGKSDKIERIERTIAIWQPKAYFKYDGNLFIGRIVSYEEDALIVRKEDGELIFVPYETEFHSIDEHDDQHTQSKGRADLPFAKRRRQVWKSIHQANRRKKSR